MTRRWLAGLAWACLTVEAHAADDAKVDAKVEVKIVGSQPAVVGQSLQVEVTILAPNFFLSAPTFPTLRVPGAVITMPDERAINSTEMIDGTSYAGIRKTYVLTPQTPGDIALTSPDIAFTFAGEDGKPRHARVTLPPTTLHVGGQQAAAAQTGPNAATLPAVPIEIAQQFDHAIDGKAGHLKAGDALVRTITIFAPGTPAMMIAPPTMDPVRGAKQYRADPQLADGATRAGTTGGRRIETVTYVFEASGKYRLPAVSVAWYDAASGKAMQSSAPAVTIDVGRAGPGVGPSPPGATLARLSRWIDRLDPRVMAGTAAVVACLSVFAYAYVRWRRRDPARWHAMRRQIAAYRAASRARGRLPPLNP